MKTQDTEGLPSSPAYILHCTTAMGKEVRLTYYPHASVLIDENGTPLFNDVPNKDFSPVVAVSPGHPGFKNSTPRKLKIQLGLGCNYSCSYCNQASEVTSATVSSTADAQAFLQQLSVWLQSSPERIEFWGGEPFLYFAKLRRLVPALKARYPKARFTIVTNGSLLGPEIQDFIEAQDLYIAISHDGPGQHMRGPDPFENTEQAANLRSLWHKRREGGRISFNVVLTPANADIAVTRQWLADRINDENPRLTTEGPATIYDGSYAETSGSWCAADYARLANSLVQGFQDGTALKYLNLKEQAEDFLKSIRDRRPAHALGQKCGMDMPDQIAVDLQGNVMTCQNTGAKGKHLIGHVSAMESIRLDTAFHWSHRDSCNYCPVLQLCKGSCMYLEDDLFAQSCENEYHYNMAILGGVLKKVTGLHLISVSGDIRRPKMSKKIKIQLLK